MNKSVLTIEINKPIANVWEVLFDQYGDIYVHNPTMQSSHYLNEGKAGELGSVRHCQFTDKLYLDEKIIEVVEGKKLTIEVTEHNLPFVKAMSATYTLNAVSETCTEVVMTSFNSFSPKFMKYLMAGQMRNAIKKHLFGMKYYLETGDTVNMSHYKKTFKNYQPA